MSCRSCNISLAQLLSTSFKTCCSCVCMRVCLEVVLGGCAWERKRCAGAWGLDFSIVLCPAPPLRPSCAVQGKIQGFGSENSSGHYSGGFSSSSGQYGGIGSSSSYSSGSGGPNRSGGMGGGIPTSFAEAQRAASQLTQVCYCLIGGASTLSAVWWMWWWQRGVKCSCYAIGLCWVQLQEWGLYPWAAHALMSGGLCGGLRQQQLFPWVAAACMSRAATLSARTNRHQTSTTPCLCQHGCKA